MCGNWLESLDNEWFTQARIIFFIMKKAVLIRPEGYQYPIPPKSQLAHNYYFNNFVVRFQSSYVYTIQWNDDIRGI